MCAGAIQHARIGRVVFAQGDVVRHDLVRRIVGAYEADVAAGLGSNRP